MVVPATAPVADACVRLGLPVRVAPGLHQARPVSPLAGRALPVRHVGSVDVFLEAFQSARPGDVLVVDNGGRLDEGCIGDLSALEARLHGVAAIVVWGAHRDEAELEAMGFPVWSLGTVPNGPLRLDGRPPDALEAAWVGPHRITRDDVVVADRDGVLFVPQERWDEVQATALAITATERAQADRVKAGVSLSRQLDLAGYLEARRQDSALTFRAHLRGRKGAIEE
jgi:regulator of RNase E activity RraA